MNAETNYKADVVAHYMASQVSNLGYDVEDPRAMAAVGARVARVEETLSHMDRPLPHETTMQAGREYSPREQ